MEISNEGSDEQDVDEGAEDDQTSVDSEESTPKLKYVRIGNHLRDILEKDAVSCVAVHPKFLCVGTVWGSVYIMDLLGYSIKVGDGGSDSDAPVTSRAILSHSVAVNQISIDARGDYIASCSDDGKIYIYGSSSPDNHRDINFGRLIRSIAIDPMYYKAGSGRRFITGDERLTLHEKTLLSRLRSTVLADASHEGGVKNARWAPAGDLVAWATLVGFRVYDLAAHASLGLIKWNKSTRVDERCHLCWKDRYTLLVGWADTVRVCSIIKRTQSQFIEGLEISPYCLQPVFTFETDFTVCGVGPLEGGLVAVLGVGNNFSSSSTSTADITDADRPHMHFIEPASNDYVDLDPNKLSLRGYQNYTSANYSLECLVDENRYVIVSPKDIVVACQLDADDQVDWLLDHERMEEALVAVESNPEKITRHTKLSIGQEYINHLISLKKFSDAAALCPRVLGNDKKLWEVEMAKFAQEQQLRSVVDYLPLEESRLSPQVYDFVLYEFLKFDPPGFLKLVEKWKPSFYNVTVIGNAVVHSLKPEVGGKMDAKSKAILVEALAILYSHEGKYDLALTTYLKIKNKKIFELIKKHNLHESMISMLENLILLDIEKTFTTLVQNKDINVDAVVAKLKSKKNYLYQYLDALRAWDSKKCEPYEGLLVELYAEFCPERLRPLLVSGGRFSIQSALTICRARGLHAETAILLEKMGNTKEALQIMITELKNIEEAVDFCIKHDDLDLWLDVINFAKRDAENVKYLLNRIGNYTNPIVLVQQIDKGQVIPGLKSSLVKMMQDYNLQVKFMKSCKRILVSDYFYLQEKLTSCRQQGYLVTENQICGMCRQKLFPKEESNKPPTELLAFHCHHIFHHYCVPIEMNTCPMCTPQKNEKKHLANT